MNIILNVQGGLGKNIVATALLQGIKKKYPKCYLIMITAYPEVFTNNPNVNKVLKHEQQNNIYENHIKDNETLFFVIDPYATSDFINNKGKLINIWFNLCGLEYANEQPEFFLSKAEKEFYSKLYSFKKPVMAIQTNGGASNQGIYYNWARDMPTPLVEQIIRDFKDKYDIVHIKRPDQITYTDTKQALDGYRSIAYLLSISEKVVAIDSFVQHLCKAINKKAIVLWVTTTSSMFGYESHSNIQSNPKTKAIPRNHSNYEEFSLVESIENLPYNDLSEIFDYNSIKKEIRLNN